MTAAIQPALDGQVPEVHDDFEEWAAKVRPAFERAAASGREFATWHIKVAEKLPDPPKPKAQWGTLAHRLHEDGLLEHAGWATTRDGSGVRLWRGTPAFRRQARRARRAAA